MSEVRVIVTEAEAHWLAGFLSPESDKSATAQGIKDKLNIALAASAPSSDNLDGIEHNNPSVERYGYQGENA